MFVAMPLFKASGPARPPALRGPGGLRRAALLLALLLAAFLRPCAAQAEDRVLRVGLNASYPPFGYVDSSGAMAGFDLEIARAVCAAMNRQCDMRLYLFSEILPAIAAGELDMAVAGMGVTRERLQIVAFSDKYFQSRSIFVIRRGFMAEVSPQGLAGLRLAARLGSVEEDWLKKQVPDAASVTGAGDNAELFALLESGAVDVAMLEGLSGYYQLRQQKDDALETLPQMVIADEAGGAGRIVVARDKAELVPLVNKAIRAIRQNGEYDKINRNFFDFDVY